MSYPQFRDVSDRQLQEALAVLEDEFFRIVEEIAEECPDDFEVFLNEGFGVNAFGFLKRRLPEMLGFVPRNK